MKEEIEFKIQPDVMMFVSKTGKIILETRSEKQYELREVDPDGDNQSM